MDTDPLSVFLRSRLPKSVKAFSVSRIPDSQETWQLYMELRGKREAWCSIRIPFNTKTFSPDLSQVDRAIALARKRCPTCHEVTIPPKPTLMKRVV